MKELHLDDLKLGLPGVTKAVGAFLAEAAAYCLDKQGHQSGINLKIFGDFNEEYALYWTDVIDTQVKRTWADQEEATEYAATAIAMLLILDLTNYTIAHRTSKGDRADYFLVQKTAPYAIVAKALLEISGIFTERRGNTMNMRIKMKKDNIDKIVNRKKTAYIVIVSFELPKAKIIRYE